MSRRDPAAWLGAGALGVIALATLLAPWLAPVDPNLQADPLGARHLPPLTRVHVLTLRDGGTWWATSVERHGDDLTIQRGEEQLILPVARFAGLGRDGLPPRRWLPLGTDRFGRDLWARLLHGGRVSLLVAGLGTAVACLLGAGFGLAAGLAPRWLDGLLMRLVDGLLAIPRLFLLLLLIALFPRDPLADRSLLALAPLVVVLGTTGWMDLARLVRGEVQTLQQRDYVTAARAGGATPWRLAWRHLVPAVLPLLAVDAALRLGDTLLLEATVSFLGLGVSPPTASWGTLIADGREALFEAWWVALPPGIAVFVTVLAASLLADGSSARRRSS